jgi:uncharacterized protein YacL
MNTLSLLSAVVWVDFFTIVLSKIFHLGKALDTWYDQFGIVAVLSDCLVIVLGIMITKFLVPNASLLTFLAVAVGVQIVHDILFYIFVIRTVPSGQNKMIDLFKEYARENSYKILIADSLMMIATILLANYLGNKKFTPFVGLFGVYALTYIIYTR